MNLGYAVFYSFHDMCCPYIIAGVYGFDKDEVEEQFANLIGLTNASQEQKDWMEYSIVRVDCTRLYHMLQLEQEVEYDITRAFQNWAPKLFERIKEGQPGDYFVWKFIDGEANRFEWLNRFHEAAWNAVLVEIDKLPKVTSGRN